MVIRTIGEGVAKWSLVVPHDVRSVADAPGAIEVLVDRDPTPGQRGSLRGLLDLQNTRTEVHGVVLVHGALVLQ